MASRDSQIGSAWTGWIGFAGIVMVVVGLLDAFQGLIAVIRGGYFARATPDQIIIFDSTGWGVIMIIWGIAPGPGGPGAALRGIVGTLVRDRGHMPQSHHPAPLGGELRVPAVGAVRDRFVDHRALRPGRALARRGRLARGIERGGRVLVPLVHPG